jgi:hypothetical protein
MLARHLRGKVGHAAARCVERHALAQLSERQQEVAATIRRIGNLANRDPDIEPPYFGEPRRRDADDRVGLPVDLRRAAHHGWRTGKTPTPQRLADHRDLLATPLILGVREITARHWRCADDAEE